MKVSVAGHPQKHELGGSPRSSGAARADEDARLPPEAPREFGAIYDEWFDEVSRWVRALGAQHADRDDIAQEVFLVVRRRLGAFDGANVAGWLYRITRRQVRDFRRRVWVKHIFTRGRVKDPDGLPDDQRNPAAAAELTEKRRILSSILDRIPEKRRSAFVLFEIEGLSGEEIAQIQEIPVNTVWTRLHVARKEFLKLAAKYRTRQLAGPAPARPTRQGRQDGQDRRNQQRNGPQDGNKGGAPR